MIGGGWVCASVQCSDSYYYDLISFFFLRKVTPKCTEVIKKCVWDGREIPCDEYIDDRKTYVGNCCLFNYQRPSDDLLRYDTITTICTSVNEYSIYNDYWL